MSQYSYAEIFKVLGVLQTNINQLQHGFETLSYEIKNPLVTPSVILNGVIPIRDASWSSAVPGRLSVDGGTTTTEYNTITLSTSRNYLNITIVASAAEGTESNTTTTTYVLSTTLQTIMLYDKSDSMGILPVNIFNVSNPITIEYR